MISVSFLVQDFSLKCVDFSCRCDHRMSAPSTLALHQLSSILVPSCHYVLSMRSHLRTYYERSDPRTQRTLPRHLSQSHSQFQQHLRARAKFLSENPTCPLRRSLVIQQVVVIPERIASRCEFLVQPVGTTMSDVKRQSCTKSNILGARAQVLHRIRLCTFASRGPTFVNGHVRSQTLCAGPLPRFTDHDFPGSCKCRLAQVKPEPRQPAWRLPRLTQVRLRTPGCSMLR